MQNLTFLEADWLIITAITVQDKNEVSYKKKKFVLLIKEVGISPLLKLTLKNLFKETEFTTNNSKQDYFYLNGICGI